MPRRICRSQIGFTSLLLIGSVRLYSEPAHIVTAGIDIVAIDQAEVLKAKAILDGGDLAKVLDDPYLASIFYYSERFMAHGGNSGLIGALGKLITPDLRRKYIKTLETLTKRPSISSPVRPLRDFMFGKCSPCHRDAIDLFTREGSLVYSMTDGVVVLADASWQPDDPPSTVSPKGGNEVIIFDAATERFYRYCHLDTLSVKIRSTVTRGQAIGTVGHTGVNASKKDHGRHLHLEVNRYDAATGMMISLPRTKLISLL